MRSIINPAAGHSILVAQITPVEVVSGVMRRQREGGISVRTAHMLRLLIDRHASRDYLIVGLTVQVIQRAENLLETYPLRAYDSLQLAAALESNQRLIISKLPALIFVSVDSRLLEFAAAEGLMSEDPNKNA